MFNFLKSKINKAGNIQRPFKSSENQEERTTILGIKNFQVIESYKQLRTNVMFAMSAKDVNVVEFSSSFPGEGKSITSANMAIAMAQTGAKVLLIDCDLRKSVQHKVFKVSNKVGLSSILGKMATLEDVVHKNVAENLDLITGGPVPPNPSELIASKHMEEFIGKVKEVYDYVIDKEETKVFIEKMTVLFDYLLKEDDLVEIKKENNKIMTFCIENFHFFDNIMERGLE